MNLEEFAGIITEKLQEKAGSGYQVERRMAVRNNQVMKMAVGAGNVTGPFMTLTGIEPYYMEYLHGNMDVEEAVEDICRVLGLDGGDRDPGMEAETLYDYRKIKDRIIFRLVSREKNLDMLQDIPHIPFLDLAVEFQLLLGENGWGQRAVMVDWELCRKWQADPRDLMDQAARNMLRLCPPAIVPVQERIKEILETCSMAEKVRKEQYDRMEKMKERIPLYILSNQREIHGASAILYPGVLKKYADMLGRDLIILPSSIHEVLLVPSDEGIHVCALRKMVQQINASEVLPEERLSDQVYLYQRGADRIVMAGESTD